MKKYRQKLGRLGERIAARYLKEKGYHIIDKNFRVREGEIDLITKQKDEIIFIEVKTRTSLIYGPPEEAINQEKQEKYAQVIERYLQEMSLKNIKWHLEVLSIFIDKKSKKVKIKHLKNL